MLLLQPEQRSQLPVVALFGVGLVGNAITEHLIRWAGYRSVHFPFMWDQPDAQAGQLKQAIAGRDSQRKVVFVWAAGSGGFTLTSAAAAAERMALNVVLCAAERCALDQGVKVPFHLVSSAGGLFEGQRLIGSETPPQPLRGYGRLKLTQETDLLSCAHLAARIYRPASVYGAINSAGRQGLIPTLISNGLSRNVTNLSGNRRTLRDYVLVEDIGRFISQSVQKPTIEPVAPMILASGRPVTLDEVVSIVGQQLRRRLLVTVGPQTNAQNITFRGDAKPDKFRATDLTTGVRWVHHQWLERGLWHQRGLDNA